MGIRPLGVSEVNNYIKRLFLSDMVLSSLSVEGEISNFKHHYSGHMYFNLKDENCKIKSVMFRGDNEKLGFPLEEGMKVVATGYISLYEREGDYQLYVRHIKESGLGDLYRAFEDLKKKLDGEGLFSQSSKKQLPSMPKKIGVVTSATGAAVHDIITVIRRRFSPAHILIYPSLVQGSQAPKELIKGLLYLDAREDVDLIITGRGGGSIEELFAFNDEELARTIYGLETPIISAVGHETDFTIADFVADLRAATPSAAAELSVPDIQSISRDLDSKFDNLLGAMKRILDDNRKEVDDLYRNLSHNKPLRQLKDRRQEVDMVFKELTYRMDRMLADRNTSLLKLKSKLDLLNPSMALDKGYGLMLDSRGRLVKSVRDIKRDEQVDFILPDGRIKSLVLDIEEGGKENE